MQTHSDAQSKKTAAELNGKRGRALLDDPFLNKGTAFTQEERERYGLVGMLPPCVQTIEQQEQRAMDNCMSYTTDIARRHFLMRLFAENRTLFFRVLRDNLAKLMPVVYNPTVAVDIENFTTNYVDSQGICFLDARKPEHLRESLANAADGRDVDLIVVTDSQAILGIGDWGTNGAEIAIGKLMVYTAAAGVDPRRVLPVVIDAGTDRDELREDPLYLGVHEPRMDDAPYFAFVDDFMAAVEEMFPGLYVHFEDFGRTHAAAILKKYEKRFPVFNDDIEGTGIITLAGILGAMRISGQSLADARYLCFGAGSAGCGVVERVAQEFRAMGEDEEQVRDHFYLVNSKGLLFDDMELSDEQRPYARKRSEFPDLPDRAPLLDIVSAVRPTILVGTSTVFGAFTQQVVEKMMEYCERPVIFPMSNPTSKSEATAADLIRWSHGRALVATGVTSAPVEFEGTSYRIGQANNALVYPGLGMGVIASHAKHVTTGMAMAAVHSLDGIVDTSEPGAPVLPPLEQMSTFTLKTARAVALEAVKEGESNLDASQVDEAIEKARWTPDYE